MAAVKNFVPSIPSISGQQTWDDATMPGDGWRASQECGDVSGVMMMMRVMKTLFALHQPWECEIWPGYDPFLAQCLSKFDVAVEPTSGPGCPVSPLPPPRPPEGVGRGESGTPGGHIWTSISVAGAGQLLQGPGGWTLQRTNLVMVLTPPGVTLPARTSRVIRVTLIQD